MRTLTLCVMALALAMTGSACKKGEGGGAAAAAADPCTWQSSCANERKSTPESQKECRDMLADKDCGPAAKSMMECMMANDKCNAEGKMDEQAYMTACEAQLTAFTQCMMKKSSIDMAPPTPEEPPAAPAEPPPATP
jgi:hypothetical protein